MSQNPSGNLSPCMVKNYDSFLPFLVLTQCISETVYFRYNDNIYFHGEIKKNCLISQREGNNFVDVTLVLGGFCKQRCREVVGWLVMQRCSVGVEDVKCGCEDRKKSRNLGMSKGGSLHREQFQLCWRFSQRGSSPTLAADARGCDRPYESELCHVSQLLGGEKMEARQHVSLPTSSPAKMRICCSFWLELHLLHC